ncbi:MAG: gamma carbonic anhydrase family protein [Polyangiaceae bacterium]|nr:gamma carbonic anhydrase family protein [Polyangiaceae bacterium]
MRQGIYEYKGMRPRLGAGVFIAPTASVIGDVELGDDASVWFGTTLRGDVFPIRVGKRTNIQDNSVVHVTARTAMTTIGDDVTIGHLSLIHGCTVGDRCLIGMGSVILDNAIIEDECLIAAGTLVPPRLRIASRSLVMGCPGKVVKTLGEADLASIRESAEHYASYAKDFLSSLRT